MNNNYIKYIDNGSYNFNKNLAMTEINLKNDTDHHKILSNKLNVSPNDKETRVDSKGNSIIKGKKIHKVSFCDIIRIKSLEEIIIVESYKEFNKDVSSNDYDEPGCTCQCILI